MDILERPDPELDAQLAVICTIMADCPARRPVKVRVLDGAPDASTSEILTVAWLLEVVSSAYSQARRAGLDLELAQDEARQAARRALAFAQDRGLSFLPSHREAVQ